LKKSVNERTINLNPFLSNQLFLLDFQTYSNIESKIDVLAVTENLGWRFDTVEIQIRGETDERLFESGSKLEL
jgi:hypothetical protein